MEFVRNYLKKHNFTPGIQEEPHPALHICIVIPCFHEPDLISTLQSLWNCTRPACAVEVIVVVNSPEKCSPEIVAQNLSTIQEINAWKKTHPDPKLKFHVVYRPDLPRKFAGVGLARKTGMDEAVHRLYLVSDPKGIIVGFDADAVCDPDYLAEIENHFRIHAKSPGASIYFEHPVTGKGITRDTFTGIISYELHLRYLNQALRYTGHPYAFHTIGSSFAVRADAYVKQGGMNKRQAGEDFYFLQKIISLGNYTEINTTRVIPSPRESDRVPFGTGAAMKHWNNEQYMKTYPFELFENLRKFISQVSLFYDAPSGVISSVIASLAPSLQEYLRTNNFHHELESIRANSASPHTFINRFFLWFNTFKVIKYLNLARPTNTPEICKEAGLFVKKPGGKITDTAPENLLNVYRKLDKEGFGLNPL